MYILYNYSALIFSTLNSVHRMTIQLEKPTRSNRILVVEIENKAKAFLASWIAKLFFTRSSNKQRKTIWIHDLLPYVSLQGAFVPRSQSTHFATLLQAVVTYISNTNTKAQRQKNIEKETIGSEKSYVYMLKKRSEMQLIITQFVRIAGHKLLREQNSVRILPLKDLRIL